MPLAARRLTISLVDMLCILAALCGAAMWTGAAHFGAGLLERGATIVAQWAVFGVVWLLTSQRLGATIVAPGRNLAFSLRRTLESWAATWGIGGLLVISLWSTAAMEIIWPVLLLGAALLACFRLTLFYTSGDVRGTRVRAVVLGSCPSARALSSSRDVSTATEMLGFVPFTNEDPRNMPHLRQLGAIDDLSATLRSNDVDVAFVSPSDDAITGEVHRAIDTCEHLGLQTQYFPSFLDVDDMRVGMIWSAKRPGLNVQAISEASFSTIAKRLLDVVGASVGILLLLPVFLACGLAVKLTGRGPMFYRQTRVGKSGKTFGCLKFRTMRVGAHAQQELLRAGSKQDGPAFKLENDPRITRVGRVLRKFSLDELPQMFNVLLGDMSLVGPRPPIPSEVDKYTWWQRRRISIKPGLTCIWQVYGRNRVSFKRWVEMDLYYIDNWSLWLDLKLIAHTVRVVVRGTGI